ncbi:hypothetical protein [Streptomyces sp. NPDC001292]|uniref:hypothetical protein n=1 Tax=Streptomyces sp. NPDC001292 TaxID=3364558 RepID=UPI0036CB17EF
MPVERLLPTREAEDLLALVRDIADKELAPRVEEYERSEIYPEGLTFGKPEEKMGLHAVRPLRPSGTMR